MTWNKAAKEILENNQELWGRLANTESPEIEITGWHEEWWGCNDYLYGMNVGEK